MTWQDEGIVLANRRHGEAHSVLSLLTRDHGRFAGLVRGGGGRRQSAALQPGNRVQAVWRARLADQLGQFTVELLDQPGSLLFDDPPRLAALASACALVDLCLPEREPHAPVFVRMAALGDLLATRDDWSGLYVLFELALLTDLGFALDLTTCAVTGGHDDLVYVSPRTGRAVGREAAGVYADRLLPLPAFLRDDGPVDDASVLAGLRLTGHFLRRHMLEPLDRAMPDARDRLIALLAKRAGLADNDGSAPPDAASS
ncbi:DNA repair protein RecO [Marinivivus vitaminiproducens]|uniref:DNA repair protein RecO n=1 Tax=Marinivivus vitaminiproducens TaxID=3035935 RepID=UPI0027980910|nr:DNA repair protein RecO [Geminicoccaceae bacterium SCSIO 64248]